MTTPIRLLIVDDHRLFTQALELLLRGEDDIKVLGTAATGEEGLEFCRETEIDVALIDIDLPGMDGVALTARLREIQPDARVVVITAFQQPGVMTRALKAGAAGYVMKTDLADTLVGAIRLAMAGSMVLPAGKLAPAVTPAALAGRPAGEAANAPRSAGGARGPDVPLSEREIEILQAIANGWSTFEMADSLAISEHTVRSHVKRILAKLDAHSKAEAVLKGVHLGMITTAPSG